MLEDEAVVREQRGLFGGNVYFAVRIARVEVAQGDVRFLREALRPTAVHGGLVEVRVEKVDEDSCNKYSQPLKVSDKARCRRQYTVVRRGSATPYEAFGG